jgi:hypothetical protein
MMQEETVDDDEDDDRERPRRGRAIRTPQVKMMGQTDDNVNDTYADFDEESPDKDVSETREEYDSEEEKDQARKISDNYSSNGGISRNQANRPAYVG